jgi:DNA-binding transcriptional LysR family regulator
MRSVHDRLNDLRLGDLTTFLAVRRCASITAAARELNVTPSQVSKAIARLEAQLGLELLSRTSRGVSLSEAGRRVAPQIETAVTRLRMLGRSDDHPQPELTVAAPSYLAWAFIPIIASSIPQLRVRSMELPPALMRA